MDRPCPALAALCKQAGSLSWASTAAELLASLAALKAFRIGFENGSAKGSHLLRCGGGTDNKATGQLVQKRLSAKWPVMIILMAFCWTIMATARRSESDAIWIADPEM